MTIKEKTPLTMSEVVVMVKDADKSALIKEFIKNFKTIPVEKVKEIKKDLEKLDLIKLKDHHIVKVIDFMPGSASELNKVVSDASLDSEEIEKILEVIKKH